MSEVLDTHSYALQNGFEGDHWQMEKINYDSDSDWSSNESEPKDPFLGAEPFTDSYRPLNGPEFELFQYWNVSLDLNTSHSTDPNTFIMLQQSESADHYYRPPNNHYVAEIDLIREVLFILQGLESSTFTKTAEYKYVKKYSIFSLSDGGLSSIMNDFADIATLLLQTELKLKELLLVKQTIVQAFANSFLDELHRVILGFSQLESQYRTGGEMKTSLLDLLSIVKQKTNRTKDISRFILSISNVDGIQIINALYNGEEFHSNFIITVRPLLEMISSCISNGIINDPFDEFFLERSEVSDQMNFVDCSKIYDTKVPEFLKEFAESIHECYKSFLLFGMTYSVDFKNIYGSVSTIKQKNTSAKRWLLHELHSHLQSIVNVDKHNLKDSFKEKLEQSLNPAFSSIKRQVADFLYKTHNIHQHIESIQQIYFLFSVDMKMIVEKMLVSKPQHWQIRSILFDGLQKSINVDFLEIRRRKETGLIFDEFELLFNCPWPVNQIITHDIQKRYNAIMRYLIKVQYCTSVLHSFRFSSENQTHRLYLLSFLQALTLYNYTVISKCSRKVNEGSLSDICTNHSEMISNIEKGLLFKNHVIFGLVEKILEGCKSCIVDPEVFRMLRDGLTFVGGDTGN